MTRRSTAGLIALALVGVMTLSCMTSPAPGGSPPAPSGTVTAPPAPTATASGGPGAATRPPLSDSARKVRDSINAFRNDSLMKVVLKSIAGQEGMPAESVFENIKVLQGIPAGRVVRMMALGFSPALGVSCGFCHVIGDYGKDDKEPKRTARVMYGMMTAINRDYLSKLPVREGRQPPSANCSTCHRGMTRPGGGPASAPPPRPGSE